MLNLVYRCLLSEFLHKCTTPLKDTIIAFARRAVFISIKKWANFNFCLCHTKRAERNYTQIFLKTVKDIESNARVVVR